jgi:hypothetical protein
VGTGFDLHQALTEILACNFKMSRADDLARLCTELVRSGNDFPTVWNTMLKGHGLIVGIPRQRHDGARSLLDISLITGERLVFDGDSKKFSVN